MILTPAGEADLPQLLRAARQVSGTPGSHWTDDYPDEEILRGDLRCGGLFRIETDSRELAGLISMGRLGELGELPWPGRDPDPCELSRLGLLPEFQGKGLALPLVRQAMDTMERQGFRTFRLLAARDYRRVISIYERCGFARVGEVDLWGCGFFQYERQISRNP